MIYFIIFLIRPILLMILIMIKKISTIFVLLLMLVSCQANLGEIPLTSITAAPVIKFTQNATFTPTFVEPTNTAVPSPSPSNSPLPKPSDTKVVPTTTNFSQQIQVNHLSIDKFSSIPDDFLAAAARERLLIRNSSVGENIRFGLECLYGNYNDRRPSACSNDFDHKYDSSKWIFQYRGNPGWIEKVDEFIQETQTHQSEYDVFMFTLGYLDGLDGMTYPQISDQDNFLQKYIQPLENLQASYPNKLFVWWTMSLAQEGQKNTTLFNQLLREYAQQNNKVLMDLADIESHDIDGNPCVDQAGQPIICKIYTDEKKSGHLNALARERTAKAFWYMMARLSGWQD